MGLKVDVIVGFKLDLMEGEKVGLNVVGFAVGEIVGVVGSTVGLIVGSLVGSLVEKALG